MRRSATSILAVGLFGCSLLNAPDRDLTPPDGGVDGGGVELFCDDGLDDDQDTVTDCADPDCAEEPVCCERRSTTLDEDWTAASVNADWIFAPTTDDPWSLLRRSFGGNAFVGGFVPSDTPRALIGRECVSLALGGWIDTTLRTTGTAGCTPDEVCAQYAGVVLTVATDSAPGSKVQDELAVTLHAGGLLLVTQADVEIARTIRGQNTDVQIEIELRPDVDASDQPIVVATVRVDGEPLLEDLVTSSIENLLTVGDCAEIPGLFVAAQGRGDHVYVGPIETAKQDCANPSQFDEQSATLSASNLEFVPSWVEAYIGAPTLASSRNALSDVQWDLIVEGSNWSPDLEPTTHVGYALGHARVDTDEGDNWRLTGWESSESPKIGDDPPACADPGCEDNRSIREAHLLAELNPDGELRDLTLSFARELVEDPAERDVFGVQVVRPIGAPTTPLPLPTVATLTPDDVPGCTSLRDPALIPVDSDASDGYWLLFTCIDGPEPPRRIEAVRISRALEVIEEGGEPMRRLVLEADTLGPFAAAGIRSPEPVISFTRDGLRLRIWFLAQRVPGDWAIALAEARSHDTEMLAFELPEPLPFPVNPILSNASTLVLSGCVSGDCSITGIAVSPRADDPERLRFLLARRLNLSGGDSAYQLIPLEQSWTLP